MPDVATNELSLARSIEIGDAIELDNLTPGPLLEARLVDTLRKLLAHYGRADLFDCLHTCSVELLTNAARANLKRIYLKDRGVAEGDGAAYATAIREFAQEFRSRNWYRRYYQRMAEEGLFVRIQFEHGRDGLRIVISNNIPLAQIDEARIRQKFARAMQATDIVDYQMRYPDDTEGEGLGFVLAVLYLRQCGLDPALLRLGAVNGATVARIEAPFTARFVSLRAARAS